MLALVLPRGGSRLHRSKEMRMRDGLIAKFVKLDIDDTADVILIETFDF